MPAVNYLIVGQGLAGSTLAYYLQQQRATIMVFDQPSENKSSAVAAGLFNPITGKGMATTWRAAPFFEYLFAFYAAAEADLGGRFFFPSAIYRPFISAQEQQEWLNKNEREDVGAFIEAIYRQPYLQHEVKNPFGGILLKRCGYLEVNAWMKALRQRLINIGSYRGETFHHDQLKVVSEGVQYQDFVAQSVIFCEGTAVRQNPYFNWLPVKPLKGETLGVRLPQQPTCIYNRGVYVVPQGNSYFVVGATYQHAAEPGATQAGLAELSGKLRALLQMPFEIADQRWGVRPTSPDRRPMLGCHPVHKNLFVFNGLGTKGVSLAPWLAKNLADHLQYGRPIEPEVRLERFFNYYANR